MAASTLPRKKSRNYPTSLAADAAKSFYLILHPDGNWLDLDEIQRMSAVERIRQVLEGSERRLDTLEHDNQRLELEVQRLREAGPSREPEDLNGRVHPANRKTYEESCNLFLTQVHLGWQFGFGISPQTVSREFRDLIQKVVTKHYPRLRRSALRQAVEGDFTGGRCPVTMVPFGLRNHVAKVLGLADACETLAYELCREYAGKGDTA